MDPLMVGAMGCPAWDVTMGPSDRKDGGWGSDRSRPGACLASRRCCDIHTPTASTPVTHASLTSLHPPYVATYCPAASGSEGKDERACRRCLHTPTAAR